MKDYKQDIEDLLIAGRSLSENEFDKLLDGYFSDKSENEKEKIGIVLMEVRFSKLEQMKNINKEISFLKQNALISLSENIKPVAMKIA